MFDKNQYMNELMEGLTEDTICEATKNLPHQIGVITIQKKRFEEGITYFDWSMCFHQHMEVSRRGAFHRDEVQMIFCMNRKVSWKIEDSGQLVELDKGEVCVYRNAELTTSMCYEQDCRFLFKSIQIPTGYFRKMLLKYFAKEQVGLMEELFIRQVTKTKITPDMYRILNEIDQAEQFLEFKELYLEGKVIELLSVVLHSIVYKKTVGIRRVCILSEEEQEAVRKLKKNIDLHPELDYGAEELAKLMSMSVTRLTKGFSQIHGTPLHGYVIQRRLEYAARLLTKENHNVSEAAVLAGYTNLSHFSNAFKRKYGVLPKEYRKC